MRSSYAITKICGVELKSRGIVIRNNFLEYRTNKDTHFARRKYCYALLAMNKANHIFDRLFSCSCSDTICRKSIKKFKKNPIFESLPILY